ncbi:MAG TPA: transcription-repair coupling factor [Candidatus Methylacidiphilales bacterium]|jgi:transcription-repair coupling factor (superfamily II helicase)|nr:transcription-repair coupling factor [Candidatus Methylacidiphilales bacterium]
MSSRFEQTFSRWCGSPELRRLADEPGPIELGSLPAPAQAFVLAALARISPKQTFLAVTPKVKAQEEMANDLEAWGAPFLFFPQIDAPMAETLPDPESSAERLAALTRLGSGFAGVVLATERALEQPLPRPEVLRDQRLRLVKNTHIDREELFRRMQESGYTREAQVQGRGQFSVRGAVVDIFSWDAHRPLRTEWEDEELISLREFDVDAQRSVQTLKSAEISLAGQFPGGEGETATLRDYLPGGFVEVRLGEDEAAEDDAGALVESGDGHRPPLQPEFFAHDFLHAARGDFIMQENRRELFLEHLRDWMGEGWEIVIFCNNEGEQKRLQEILSEAQIPLEDITFQQRPLLRGFVWPAGKLVVLSDAEIFGRYQTLRALRQQERLVSLRSQHQALDFSEIADGDYVVHLHHGIALYKGVTTLPGEEGAAQGAEVLVLEFAEQSKLYVPVEQSYLVTKYVGVGKRHPSLDALGGSRWERAKISAQKAVMDYAAQLLSVQADRDALPGHAYPPDTQWQQEFEDAFVYEETEDQARSILETKRDMESKRPMDRLICGDVGFGKTEVAIRAIFKAVQEGKQAAFLVPTTILAEQHWKNLRERYASYPVRVDCLSRLQSAKAQRATVAGIKDGSVDVVIGTHRLLSKDIRFKELGLVVVDEEQRFGVKQKEKFKQLFRLVDVLTLSATPIPRTLYLSLTGARDMSTIETAPPNRHPVQTIVAPYDERVIREAIERELARNGQVYFLHNRIHSIHEVESKLRQLVPKARIVVGHGQMDPEELEDVMSRFVSGEADVLLSTTIIESGLDIPNANTIIIDRADRFGLADLYQLRGRVGRAQNRAYAYLFLPRHLMTVGDAKKRVSAIKQYSQLGAGFKIAMRDLEIRGAGNLLGTAQSGHITAVGFDLYCQLLKTAVARLKGEKTGRLVETKLDLDFIAWQENEADEDGGKAGAFLPKKYLAESRWRMDGYRRIAEANSAEDLDKLRNEWRDRYGPWPEQVERLLLATEIKILSSAQRIRVVETQGDKLMFSQGQDYIMVSGKFPRLTASDATSRLREIISWLVSLRSAP